MDKTLITVDAHNVVTIGLVLLFWLALYALGSTLFKNFSGASETVPNNAGSF